MKRFTTRLLVLLLSLLLVLPSLAFAPRTALWNAPEDEEDDPAIRFTPEPTDTPAPAPTDTPAPQVTTPRPQQPEAAATDALEKDVVETPEPERDATELNRYVRFEQSGHSRARDVLLASRFTDSIEYAPYEQFSITWPNASETPASLCIQWETMPRRVRIRMYGEEDALLSDAIVPQIYDTVLPLPEGTQKVTVIADADGMTLARLALYGTGRLPDQFQPWEPTPDHLDYLIVAAHADNDIRYFGSIVPTYGAEQGYVGTIAYVTTIDRNRIQESLLGARAMGLTKYPLFLGYLDVVNNSKDYYVSRFMNDTVTLSLVRLLREYRPLVVFSHDLDGEDGNWQNQIVAEATLNAVQLASDPAYDPLSAESFGIWSVQKCYLHLYVEDELVIDIAAPLTAFDGKTALEVAEEAYTKHISQRYSRNRVQGEEDAYPMNRFGLAFGTHEDGDDPFADLDPTLLSSYVPPAETPAPTPSPTEEPPAPTEEPTKAPQRTTERPDQSEPTNPLTEAPETDDGSQAMPLLYKLFLIAAVLGIAVLGVWIWIDRKRH